MNTRPISKIIVGERHRKAMGDIAGLGLLQPVVVSTNNTLIDGGRRLAVPPYHVGERLYSGLTKFPPCRHCGSDVFKVEPGTEIHAARLACAKCGRFNKWLRRALVDGGSA